MRHTRFLILLALLITLTACAPAPAPAPVPTATALPPTDTPTLAPTATPEPTQVPKPAGWQEGWLEVQGFWLSPEMAAYVEKHNGMAEEIDGVNYFTNTVTETIDDQSQDVKIKLLEESEEGVMIPSYETVQELFGANNARVVLELNRMKNAEDALFVVRSGEYLQVDVLRVNAVIQGFVDRVNTERGDNVWPMFVLIPVAMSKTEKSIRPSMLYSCDFMPNEDVAQEKNMLFFGTDPRRTKSLLFTHILGTDEIIGYIPTSDDGVINLAMDQSVFLETVFKVYSPYPSYNSFSSMIDNLLNFTEEREGVYAELPVFQDNPFINLPTVVQDEWANGPVMYFNELPESEQSYLQNALQSQWAGTGLSALRGKILWISDYRVTDNKYYK